MYCLSSSVARVGLPAGGLLDAALPALWFDVISINYLTQLRRFGDGLAVGIRRLIKSILNIYHVLILVNLL